MQHTPAASVKQALTENEIDPKLKEYTNVKATFAV